MSSITRKVLTALVASAVTASAASAQLVGYSTSGFFTSAFATCNGTAVCTGGGFTLSFTPEAPITVSTPTTGSLGDFLLTATGGGTVNVPPGQVMFTLVINQTTPSGGTGNFVGSVSGNVTTVPGPASQLVFRPNSSLSIGDVRYDFVLDASGNRQIAINRNTSLEANINVVPEPATVLLMGSGLAALGFFGARRKKA
jgi:hypothetical protein